MKNYLNNMLTLLEKLKWEYYSPPLYEYEHNNERMKSKSSSQDSKIIYNNEANKKH